jgi:hypothetical protein
MHVDCGERRRLVGLQPLVAGSSRHLPLRRRSPLTLRTRDESRIDFLLAEGAWLGRFWRRALTADENRSWVNYIVDDVDALYSFRLFNLVTMAAGPHPFPSRTRSLSPPAPMVLHSLWESRSSPGFFKLLDTATELHSSTKCCSKEFFYNQVLAGT